VRAIQAISLYIHAGFCLLGGSQHHLFMSLLKLSIFFSFLLSMLTLTSCITKQVTTSNGAVVDEKYIIKRPVKKFIETVEFE
jgi:hypothetical protein